MRLLLLIIVLISSAYPAFAVEYTCKILHVYKWQDDKLNLIDSKNLMEQLLPLHFDDNTGVLNEDKYKVIQPMKGHGELIAESHDKLKFFRLRDSGNKQFLSFLNSDSAGMYTGTCEENTE